jgi:hypothetical protein
MQFKAKQVRIPNWGLNAYMFVILLSGRSAGQMSDHGMFPHECTIQHETYVASMILLDERK